MPVIAPDAAIIKTITKTIEQIADPVRKAHAIQLAGKIAKRVIAPQAEISAKQKAAQTADVKQDANREAARERQVERRKGRDIELGD